MPKFVSGLCLICIFYTVLVIRSVRSQEKAEALLLGESKSEYSTAKYVKGYAGKKFPAEWVEHPALIDGYKVLQLTTNEAEDSKFYLTTDSYFPDLNAVAFVSNRSWIWNIYYCDLETGEITQVTDFFEAGMGDGHGNVCSYATNEVIYYDKPDNTLHRVSLVTYEDVEFYQFPDGYKRGNSLTSNADGSIIGITAIKGDKGNVSSSKMIFVDLDGNVIEEITRQDQQLSHVNINTSGTKPGVIYARKEIEDNKRFYYMSLDGEVDVKFAEEHSSNEGVSHPFWAEDGSKTYYLRKLRGNNKRHWLGYYDIETQQIIEYEKSGKDSDMDANFTDSLFVGSGKSGDPCLKFWRIQGDKLVQQRVFEHGSSFEGSEARDIHNNP